MCVCMYVCMCMAVAENSSTSTWQKRHYLPSTTPNIGWKCSSCSRWLSPQRRESAYSEIMLGMVRQKWQTGDFPVTRPEVRRKGARFSFVSRHTKRKVPKTLDSHWHNAYGPTSLSLCLFEDGLVVYNHPLWQHLLFITLDAFRWLYHHQQQLLFTAVVLGFPSL